MRLETVCGYCIDKYTASLPLTNKTQSFANVGDNQVEDKCPYSCLQRERRRIHARNVEVELPHVRYIDRGRIHW